MPFGNIASGLDYIYTLRPDLLIVDLPVGDASTIDMLNMLKERAHLHPSADPRAVR